MKVNDVAVGRVTEIPQLPRTGPRRSPCGSTATSTCPRTPTPTWSSPACSARSTSSSPRRPPGPGRGRHPGGGGQPRGRSGHPALPHQPQPRGRRGLRRPVTAAQRRRHQPAQDHHHRAEQGPRRTANPRSAPCSTGSTPWSRPRQAQGQHHRRARRRQPALRHPRHPQAEVGTVLTGLSPGLKVLDQQRGSLLTMLRSLDTLSDVAVDTVNRSKDDMIADLKALAPTLQRARRLGQGPARLAPGAAHLPVHRRGAPRRQGRLPQRLPRLTAGPAPAHPRADSPGGAAPTRSPARRPSAPATARRTPPRGPPAAAAPATTAEGAADAHHAPRASRTSPSCSSPSSCSASSASATPTSAATSGLRDYYTVNVRTPPDRRPVRALRRHLPGSVGRPGRPDRAHRRTVSRPNCGSRTPRRASPTDLQAVVASLSAVGEQYIDLRPEHRRRAPTWRRLGRRPGRHQLPAPVTDVLSSVNDLASSVTAELAAHGRGRVRCRARQRLGLRGGCERCPDRDRATRSNRGPGSVRGRNLARWQPSLRNQLDRGHRDGLRRRREWVDYGERGADPSR